MGDVGGLVVGRFAYGPRAGHCRFSGDGRLHFVFPRLQHHLLRHPRLRQTRRRHRRRPRRQIRHPKRAPDLALHDPVVRPQRPVLPARRPPRRRKGAQEEEVAPNP